MGMFLILTYVAASLSVSHGCEEIPNFLINGDFETGLDDQWRCQGGCTLTLSTDVYQGSKSVMVTDRSKNWNGIARGVILTDDTYYSFKGQIKLLTLAPGTLYDMMTVVLRCSDSNNNDAADYTQFDAVRVRLGKWTQFGGARYVRPGLHSCHVYVQVMNPEVNYVVDALSFTEIPKLDNWFKEAEARIELLRKTNLKIKMAATEPGSYTVELQQTRSAFGIGSAIGATEYMDPANKNYHDFFVENFEWAVIENALKWRGMEWTQGNINYERPDLALTDLENNGIKVRGHNVVWGVDKRVPNWVLELSGEPLKTQLSRRINYVVNFTKGRVEHWDVNNENLHGDWFEQTLGDSEVSLQMFRDVHTVDPDVKLFLNEFGVLKSNMATGVRNEAFHYMEEGVPLHGIGVQSHLSPVHVDITLMKHRLDSVAETGLPIWITEVSMDEADASVKAQALTDILTLYFSHPSIEGFLLWGFWDGKLFKENAKLFEGSDLTPNEAGTAFLDLMSKWKTNESLTLSENEITVLRAFKGDYSIIVKRDGVEVKRLELTLDESTTLEIVV